MSQLFNYPQLLHTVFGGKAILFFGAGASRGARLKDGTPCPLGPDLAEDLMQQFLRQSAGSWSLGKVVDCLERNRIDRTKINTRVFEVFDPFVPHEPYRQLFDFRWRAFFTTNFDTLIRQAYEQTKAATAGKQQLVEVLYHRMQVDYVDPSKLYLFALHGSLSHYLDLSTPLVLTEQDKIKTRDNRIGMLEKLASLQGGGTVIYVGYSFGDEVFWELLNLLESIQGLSWSYALMPGLNGRDKSYLAQYKVEGLDLTFEQFMDELIEAAKQQGVRIEPAKHTLRLAPDKQDTIELTEEVYHYVVEHFELLTEELLGQVAPEPINFYRGYDAHWSFYERECDVIRWQTRKIYETVCSYMERSPDAGASRRANPVVLVSTTAGAGKSVLLRRVAFDCYRQKGYLVVWARPDVIHTQGWDVQRLKQLSQLLEARKLLVVVDNCAGIYSDKGKPMYGCTADLIAALEAETIPCVVLLAARPGEFYSSHDERRRALETEVRHGRGHEAYVSKPLIRADEHLDFEDKLEDNEVIELVQKMHYHGALSSDLPDEVYIGRIKGAGKMLLMALYEVTDRYLRPFDEIVAEEFANLQEPELEPEPPAGSTLGARIPAKVWAELRERLGLPPLEPLPEAEPGVEKQEAPTGKLNLTQRAYIFVSAAHQFGVRLPEPCLRRELQVNWDEFMQKVVQQYALRVIVRDERQDPPLYQTRHPLIASTVFNSLLNAEGKYRVIRQIIEHIDPSSWLERSMMYQLLDADEFQSIFDPYQRCDLYLHALKRNGEDTFLLQHLGMLHMKEVRDLDKATHYLEAARALQPDNPAILNSLGILAGKKGQWRLQQGDLTTAERQFNQAEQLFRHQRELDPSNEYVYHPYAWMIYQRARETEGEAEQLSLLAQALYIIEEGMTNIPPERQFLLPQLELDIFLYLERVWVLDRLQSMSSQELATNADATYILGRYEDRQGQAKLEVLDRVEQALNEKPYDRALLRQKAIWLSRLKPHDIDERLKVLSLVFNMDPHDVWVARQLSYLSFLVEDIDTHRKCRQILYEVRLHPERSIPQMVRDPKTNELKTYWGVVGEIDEVGQRGWILREPRGDKVFFQPFKFPRLRFVPGMRVRFTAGINFMGAVAHDIQLA
jgi:tetratricopeptide (TPR) repeat protein